jgi:hypothetical protein
VIDGSAVGLTPAPPATDLSATSQLQPGQRLAGRVLEAVAADQFLIALGDSRLVAQSTQPLVPGQRITLEVVQAIAGLELRLVAEAPASPSNPQATDAGSDQRLAVAALVTALTHGGFEQSAQAASGRALLVALASALPDGTGALSATDLAALTHLLPIEPETDATLLATRLRAAFESGGQLFEAHLRDVLADQPSLSAEHALDHLRDDARAFLGRAATALGSEAASALTATARQQLDSTASHMLGQQAKLALDWIANGVVSFEVPVRLPSGDTRASITVQRDRDSEKDESGQPAFQARFRITSDTLGPIDTRVSWMHGSLNAVISVDNPGARQRLEPEMAALTQGLQATFAHVQTDLRVDTARTGEPSASHTLPEVTGGSLLNVRA